MGLERLALVVGGAKCVWQDVEKARALQRPDVTIVINDIGTVWPHELDHWVSFHADLLLKHWMNVRREKGLPPPGKLWSGPAQRQMAPGVTYHDQKGGSSGLLATTIALEMAEKVIIAGIPMDPTMANWSSGKPWKEGIRYVKAWSDATDLLIPRVRSMSGWTAELLGEPTKEWLDGPAGTVAGLAEAKQTEPTTSP